MGLGQEFRDAIILLKLVFLKLLILLHLVDPIEILVQAPHYDAKEERAGCLEHYREALIKVQLCCLVLELLLTLSALELHTLIGDKLAESEIEDKD